MSDWLKKVQDLQEAAKKTLTKHIGEDNMATIATAAKEIAGEVKEDFKTVVKYGTAAVGGAIDGVKNADASAETSPEEKPAATAAKATVRAKRQPRGKAKKDPLS